MLMTYVSGNAARAAEVLHPFRETLKPIVDQSVSVSNMFAASHVADGNFETTPNRMLLQGAMVSDIWTGMVTEVWDCWREFTQKDDCKQTLVTWEIGRPEKIAEVGRADTAFHARDPHYMVVIHGGYVGWWHFFLWAVEGSSLIAATAFQDLTRALELSAHRSLTICASTTFVKLA